MIAPRQPGFHLRRAVARMLRSAGIDQPVRHGLITGLDALRIPHDLNTGDLVGDVQRFMRRSAHHLKAWPADPAPRVLFFSVRAMSPHIPYDTGIMAHGIRLRGGARLCRGDARPNLGFGN